MVLLLIMAFLFFPFSADVCGIIHQDGSTLISQCALAYSNLAVKPYSYAVSLFRRRVSFAIKLGAARQLVDSYHSK